MCFAKVPVKKALSEAGLVQLTGAEQVWYVVQCIALGAGYFAKIPVRKADPGPHSGGGGAGPGCGARPSPGARLTTGLQFRQRPSPWPGRLAERNLT
jgi:hypothetical protein